MLVTARIVRIGIARIIRSWAVAAGAAVLATLPVGLVEQEVTVVVPAAAAAVVVRASMVLTLALAAMERTVTFGF